MARNKSKRPPRLTADRDTPIEELVRQTFPDRTVLLPAGADETALECLILREIRRDLEDVRDTLVSLPDHRAAAEKTGVSLVSVMVILVAGGCERDADEQLKVWDDVCLADDLDQIDQHPRSNGPLPR